MLGLWVMALGLFWSLAFGLWTSVFGSHAQLRIVQDQRPKAKDQNCQLTTDNGPLTASDRIQHHNLSPLPCCIEKSVCVRFNLCLSQDLFDIRLRLLESGNDLSGRTGPQPRHIYLFVIV